MNSDYGNNKGLDEMVMVDEERKRAEEARRKKVEAERKRKVREEAKRKKAAAEKARKEKDERSKARNERREQSEKHRNIAESTNFDTENSFSPKPNTSGIMESSKPKFDSIAQIQDAQKAQKKLIDDLRKKQWGDLSTGTDEIQIINTQNVDKAKQGLKNLDNELPAAYGLGKDGYWAQNSKSYGQVKEPSPAQTYAATGAGRRPASNLTAGSMMMRDNPEVAYGIGNSVGVGAHPENAYGIGTGAGKRPISDLTARSMMMRDNPEVAYGIGNSVGAGAHPENAYGIGTGAGKRPISDLTARSMMMRKNPEVAYGIGNSVGAGAHTENAYGIGTGGVSGNKKPSEGSDTVDNEGNWFDDVVNWTEGTAEDVSNAVTGAINDAGQWVEGTAEDVVNWTEGTAEDVSNAITDAVNDVVDWTEGTAEDVSNAITEAVNDAVDWTEGTAEDVSNAIADAVNDVVDWTEGTVEDVSNAIIGAVEDAVNWTEGAAEDTGEWVSNAAQDVGNWVEGVVFDREEVSDNYNPEEQGWDYGSKTYLSKVMRANPGHAAYIGIGGLRDPWQGTKVYVSQEELDDYERWHQLTEKRIRQGASTSKEFDSLDIYFNQDFDLEVLRQNREWSKELEGAYMTPEEMALQEQTSQQRRESWWNETEPTPEEQGAMIEDSLPVLINQIGDRDGWDATQIERVFEDFEAGNAFDSELLFSEFREEEKQKDDVYSKDYGVFQVEMTVMNEATVRPYNGTGILEGQFGWVTDPNSYAPPVFGIVDAQIDGNEQYNNPSKILRCGDVRISTSTTAPDTGDSQRVDYFFRDGKLLFAENSITGETILGEDYDKYWQEMDDYLYNT